MGIYKVRRKKKKKERKSRRTKDLNKNGNDHLIEMASFKFYRFSTFDSRRNNANLNLIIKGKKILKKKDFMLAFLYSL